jgi:hypothetical protein
MMACLLKALVSLKYIFRINVYDALTIQTIIREGGPNSSRQEIQKYTTSATLQFEWDAWKRDHTSCRIQNSGR